MLLCIYQSPHVIQCTKMHNGEIQDIQSVAWVQLATVDDWQNEIVLRPACNKVASLELYSAALHCIVSKTSLCEMQHVSLFDAGLHISLFHKHIQPKRNTFHLLMQSLACNLFHKRYLTQMEHVWYSAVFHMSPVWPVTCSIKGLKSAGWGWKPCYKNISARW